MNTHFAPPLYSPLPSPEELRRWDAAAAESFALPPAVLMENAAGQALEVLRAHVDLNAGTRVLIFMGKGNNGGDGAALARMLHDQGVPVLAAATSLDSPPSPADGHVRSARLLGVPFLCAESDEVPPLPGMWSNPDVVVDALTGSGLRGALRPRELAFVRAVNGMADRAFVLALDTPSGLCGDTGRAMPEAVRARLTVAFEAPVRGLCLPGAERFTGALVTRRIGMPLAVRSLYPCAWNLLAPRKSPWFNPPSTMHKGDAGRVLVIGGSRGMTGAPRLAALGALRAGAGLVHLALPGGAAPEAGGAQPEFMTHAIGRGPFFTADDVEAVLALMEAVRPQAMALGPGLGRDAGTAAMVRALLARPSRPPCVVDADALYALRPNASEGEEGPSGLLSPSDIITPHPGEAAALLPERFFAQRAGTDGCGAKGVQDRRPDALAALIEACGAVVALKGAGTLVGRRGKPVVLCPTATAALAVGGSGDVLAGVIAAKAASGMASFDAACLGVHLHARAGELLENRAPGGHLAGEIASAVPLAWKELCAP